MKTFIDIDEKLLIEAIRLTGARTKRQAINLSLAELVRRQRLDRLKSRLGKGGLDLTLECLRRLRNGG